MQVNVDHTESSTQHLGLLHTNFSPFLHMKIGESTKTLGFPGGLVVKNRPANAGDIRKVALFPGSGRFPGVENGNLLQYSCLENSMDRVAWWATVHGVARSLTQLSMHTLRIQLQVTHWRKRGSSPTSPGLIIPFPHNFEGKKRFVWNGELKDSHSKVYLKWPAGIIRV